jgi:hypothetical protein
MQVQQRLLHKSLNHKRELLAAQPWHAGGWGIHTHAIFQSNVWKMQLSLSWQLSEAPSFWVYAVHLVMMR